MRTRTLVLLATVLTVVPISAAGVVAGVAAGRAGSPEAPSLPVESSVSDAVLAAQVLRLWDHRRAAAWSRGDAVALADLYTPRSRTGARDVAELRRWIGRGLHVVRLGQQVAELRVSERTPRRWVLRVTDRTVGGVAVGRHRRTALPSSAWVTHRIRLRRAHGRWRVEEVLAQPAR